MKPIICFGEALIDCLNTGSKNVDGLSIPEFSHYPGGAPANVSVALAKLKANTYFAGQIGDDAFGEQIKEALKHYDVKLDHLLMSSTHATAMAFVHLDADGERSFTFLRNETADLHYQASSLDWDLHSEPGILHLCSNTLCESGINDTTANIIKEAKARKWKVSFDINFRHNLWADLSLAPARVEHILEQSDIIKASLEDIQAIWPTMNNASFVEKWANASRKIFITDGGEAVNLYSDGKEASVAIPETKVVDTTAAGDSFIAGALYCLSQVGNDNWSIAELTKAAELGVRCGSITVSRAGSYSALPHQHELNT